MTFSGDDELGKNLRELDWDYKYLICLDFEATCWKDPDFQNAEIIEFGAVLLNVQNKTIESEFHEYVRPTHRPILSDYCVKLTNITQELIDRQAPFPIVYQKFLTWLVAISNTKQMHFSSPQNQSNGLGRRNPDFRADISFCSWTGWDLGHFFRLECERHALEWPQHLRAWINIKKYFPKGHTAILLRQSCNFAEALQLLNITRIGNEHSAIDDARTLASVVINLKHRCPHIDLGTVTDWRW